MGWWIAAALAADFLVGEFEASNESDRLNEQARLNDEKAAELERRLKDDIAINRKSGAEAVSDATVDISSAGFDTTSGSGLATLASLESAVAFEKNSIVKKYTHDITVTKNESRSLRRASSDLGSFGAVLARGVSSASAGVLEYYSGGGKGSPKDPGSVGGKGVVSPGTNDKYRGTSLRNPYAKKN